MKTSGPSATEPTAIQRGVVGGRLRELREHAELSRPEVARRLGLSVSTLRRIELAEVKPKPPHVTVLCQLYGVTPKETEELLAITKTALRRDWWEQRPWRTFLTPDEQQTLRYESGAQRIRVYSTVIMPRMVLSGRYAEALQDPRDPHAAHRLTVWERRQEILLRPGPDDRPRLWIVLGEPALHCRVGDPETMAEQITHLIRIQESGRAVIQIHPLSAGPTMASGMGTWSLVRFDEPELPDRVVRVTPRGNEFLTLDADLLPHFVQVMDDAVAGSTAIGKESVAMMKAARALWRQRS